MAYSKIKTIKAVNFRSIGSIDIDMSSSPIVALVGTNESGKSSIIKAFGAAAGNLWRTRQNQNVRSGTDGFAVLVELEDGTKVLRKKSSNINGYTLVTGDGQRRDATKIDVEIPDFIQVVMGLFRDPETKECLQFRTCDDPLLFVQTTDGQNYKAVHNAINNFEVREATNKAKADASNLAAQAEKKRAEIEVYKKQLAELPLLDTDYLKVVLSALERASGVSVLFDEALKNLKLVESLDGDGAAKKLKKCKTVDAEAVRLFTDAMRHLNTVKEAKERSYDNVDTVDASVLPLFEKARKYASELKVLDGYTVPDTVLSVNGGVLPLFERGLKYVRELKALGTYAVPDTVVAINADALALFEKAKAYASNVSELTDSIDKLMSGIETVTNVLKASGMQVVVCDNCGHEMAVPLTV